VWVPDKDSRRRVEGERRMNKKVEPIPEDKRLQELVEEALVGGQSRGLTPEIDGAMATMDCYELSKMAQSLSGGRVHALSSSEVNSIAGGAVSSFESRWLATQILEGDREQFLLENPEFISSSEEEGSEFGFWNQAARVKGEEVRTAVVLAWHGKYVRVSTRRLRVGGVPILFYVNV